ncbi:MAG: hypothetical protein IK088_01315 [Lachnospiraceae bacterium]|nr:hypothetical protein [Lachnospiraceae bacterium]
MKRIMALVCALALIVTFTGCVRIIMDGSSEESKKETVTPDTETETEKETSSEAEPSESATEDEGGHHNPPEPTTDESGMRYSYAWLSGYYRTHNSTPDAETPELIPNCEILFYENGLFAAEGSEYGFNEGYIGNYYIIDDTIYLHAWFMTGGGMGALALTDTEFVMGINMDGSLISGTYYRQNMALFKGSEKDAELFEKENGFYSVLQGMPLFNEFYDQHPEAY